MMVLDSVCGQPVDEDAASKAHLVAEYHGRTYYFCSEKCRDDFLKSPDLYAARGTEISPDAEPRPVTPNPPPRT